MIADRLIVIADWQRMGVVHRDDDGRRLRFVYHDDWLADSSRRFPLSVSMPLSANEHDDEAIRPFLDGLLPDRNDVRKQWGKLYQCHDSAVDLLEHVGEDCAGAVRFVRPDCVMRALSGFPARVDWLSSDGGLAERMSHLRRNPAAMRFGSDKGRTCLAGAQAKTAFYYDGESDAWGVPYGGIATTHILKPSHPDFPGFAENEHFCLRLSEELGLPTAKSKVMPFPEGCAIAVERYDRLVDDEGRVARIHQEDMCQALRVAPQFKYQHQGGPSASDLVGLLRRHASKPDAAVETFAASLVLNWLICGTDAHAKNFSIIHEAGGSVRPAPTYDIASVLPYPDKVDLRRAGMAMKIGGEYRMRDISLRNWEKFADENAISWPWLRDKIAEMIQAVPEAAKRVADQMREDGIEHDVVDRMPALLAERMLACAKKPSWQV